MQIEIANAYKPLDNPGPKIEQIVAIIQNSRFKINEGVLSVVFTDEATICQIHQQFLGDPSPTDVITFPGDHSQNFTGEIFISADQAKKNALAFKTSFDYELTLYFVHGCLHLYGLKDKTDTEKEAMRSAENELLSKVKAANEMGLFCLNDCS